MGGASRVLGIPFAALQSVLFGLFLASFPVGALVFFEGSLGGDINHEYPITHTAVFAGTDLYLAPAPVTVGDVFVAAWAIYAVVFAVALLGPRQGFSGALSDIVSRGRTDLGSNSMSAAIRWFSILVAASALTTIVQAQFGVETLPPPFGNDLVQYLLVMLAPAAEEAGFRLLLIGIPLLALGIGSVPLRGVPRFLWRPGWPGSGRRRTALLIVVSSALFGAAHVAPGDGWSEGKLAQAAASGLILGWAYVRYGLGASIIIHWAANYFIFSYAALAAHAGGTGIIAAFETPLLASIEGVVLASGVASAGITLLAWNRRRSEVKGRL
ncbi:Abortive infection protein [Nitrosopumilaceae archaeon]|nr:CPBP family intramembrane metalloprotease [Nitrosopumilus sp.]CAI9831234.1 Abortive infection protein [Nitrosopumilaceae archaeon]MDA7940738.1 CPBP family intramembrane metalloprotease [Nitrosopumilus sp.]MDA7942946.1 CPBP family intramembrane metalloprotease [Nitrosopumilus sp.]MDA7944644.1 CPBP family intramembrane metalloprotease [Nitrosopumilus sp.]